MRTLGSRRREIAGLLLALAATTSAATGAAAETPAGVVGRNGWLFYRYEASEPSSLADSQLSVGLISRLARVFARNEVALAVTLVPLKMRVYAEHLPPEFPLPAHVAGQHDRLAKAFRDQGVHFIDINAAFLSSPKRKGDDPFFLRLDTHWSPSGAVTAAEAIRAGIEKSPALRAAYERTPVSQQVITWAPSRAPTPANDLVAQLPPGSAIPGRELALDFTVKRAKAPSPALLGTAADPQVTLLGSSYSADWTRFPEAVRHALQRDVLSISVPANQGSWVGLESYLSDDAFQTARPRLLIWELPERDMIAPPDMKYREARYRVDNIEWLLRAAAWVESRCEPAKAAVKSASGALARGPVAAGAADYVELAFDRPLDRLDYLSARVVSDGSFTLTLEASRAVGPPRRFTIAAAGDDQPHAFRTPLYAGPGMGFDKVRIYPGKALRFSLEDVRLCRHLDDQLLSPAATVPAGR